MSRRGKNYAYSIICAHLCSHSPEFEILIANYIVFHFGATYINGMTSDSPF